MAKFMEQSNIKNNILIQENSPLMSMQVNKFNINGWTYKQLSDIKLRSAFMEDHMNGRYCNRQMKSKKDDEKF